ncbi:hypothetical protein D3C76_1773140 [compost metagenome]
MPAFIYQIKSKAIQPRHYATAAAHQQGYVLFDQGFSALHPPENAVNVAEDQPVQQRHHQ